MDFEQVWEAVSAKCRARGWFFLDEEDRRKVQELYRDGHNTDEIAYIMDKDFRGLGREFDS
jgi:hypothetical protein